MNPITDLQELLTKMDPTLNVGEYVFTTVSDINLIPREKSVCEMKEKEGVTVVLLKSDAELLDLSFDFIASWITLNVHSALEAVGLTAAFASELAQHQISCNVIAGFYHDHIFVEKKDEAMALRVLLNMSGKS